jgi:hypothetical protein
MFGNEESTMPFLRSVLALMVVVSVCTQGLRQQKGQSIDRVEFSCKKSTGGASSVPTKMTLSDSGIEWKFLNTPERDVPIPWDTVSEWNCYGKTSGYELDFAVTRPPQGGGTFQFSRSDLMKVTDIFEQHVGNKNKRKCDWSKE